MTHGARWSGRTVLRARAVWARRLPLPCSRCGRPVEPWQRWQVDHLTALADGGWAGEMNQWPAHGSCNERAGNRTAAAHRGRTGRWRL